MFIDVEADGYIEIVIGSVIFCGYDIVSNIGYHHMSDEHLIKNYAIINSKVLDMYILKGRYAISTETNTKRYIDLLRGKVRG